MERFTTSLPYSNSSSHQQVIAEDVDQISIFDADKYFNENEGLIQDNDGKKNKVINPRLSSDDGYGSNATPTEASWNSQSGLLSHPPASITLRLDERRNKKKNNKGSSSKWFFRHRCPCSGKESVQVEENQLKSNSNFSFNNTSFKSSIICQNTEKIVGIIDNNKTSKEQSLGIDVGRTKIINLVPAIISEDEDIVLDCPYSPDKHFPAAAAAQISNHDRVVTSGRSFGDGSGGGFSFPILNPPQPHQTVISKLQFPSIGKQLIISSKGFDEPPRESLEVFQPLDDSIVQGKLMERHGLMSLREEINHRSSFNHPGDAMSDDAMSDASSDLFEIESFSTQSTMYPMYRRRDSLDDISSYDGRRFIGRRSLDETTTIAATEFYEPSEASIDWSVTTAEGFSVANLSISASEYQDVHTDHSKKIVAINNARRRGNGGLLTNCRCEKAVNVAPRQVKEQNQHQHNRSCAGAPAEESRIQAASRLGSMHVSRSNSARMFRALTTH